MRLSFFIWHACSVCSHSSVMSSWVFRAAACSLAAESVPSALLRHCARFVAASRRVSASWASAARRRLCCSPLSLRSCASWSMTG